MLLVFLISLSLSLYQLLFITRTQDWALAKEIGERHGRAERR